MEPTYVIVGYDKDADVYVRLATIHDGLTTATKIATCMATMGLKRKSNAELFDWIEVLGEFENVRHIVIPCV